MPQPRDPRVTDLRRYRRERARRARAKPARAPRERLLGARPRAGVILVLVAVVLAALWWFQRT